MAYLDINRLFTYHPPQGDQGLRYQELRTAAKAYAEKIVALTPESAEQTLAIRAVQQAAMLANAAIAINEVRE